MAHHISPLRKAYQDATYDAEAIAIDRALSADRRSAQQIEQAQALARHLIEHSRANKEHRSLLDAFMDEFGLNSAEGVALMCLAESIVRVPDQETADALIAEKIGDSQRWREHLGESESLLVNASTWALMLTGEVVELGLGVQDNFSGWFGQLVNRVGEPVIRRSLRYAMKLLGNEFVFATTAQEAVESARDGELYSFDMLGEAARTEADAQAYLAAYERALQAIGPAPDGVSPLACSGISVKLSALYPRYETLHSAAVHGILYPRLLKLARQAAANDVQLTIDAEEANRLDLSMDLLERLMGEPDLQRWAGLGLALQAYGKRALPLIDYLAERSASRGRRLIVRLVKGAYWDSEIKLAQQLGVPDYPVFTNKAATDLSYLSCAQRLLEQPDVFYPQFATHNAHTLANVLQIGQGCEFELQRLHGMGDLLYRVAQEQVDDLPTVRVYAPVGPHKHLMAYLIRRLLENGANSSFVNRFLDEDVPIERLVRNVRTLAIEQHSSLPLPTQVYGDERRNSTGYEVQDPAHLQYLEDITAPWLEQSWGEGTHTVLNPADPNDRVGQVDTTPLDELPARFARAAQAQPIWDAQGARRARVLDAIGDLFEQHSGELLALLMREAGKTRQDAIDELREAVDFARYYAAQCVRLFEVPQTLPGPTGETNQLRLHGRGSFVCISPWNFPLAIFTGQVCAALAAGNAVFAKPAEQTPLIAERAAALMRQAGVPGDVLHCIQGDGGIGAALVAHPDVAGVAFTGSTEVANLIHRDLAAKGGVIVPLIAETGGLNAMIVDSTAMYEQVVDDVLRSAFGSAGQRCSALRILCLQEDIAADVEAMLTGAMDLLSVADPREADSDVGPIIDAAALARLQAYVAERTNDLISATPMAVEQGHFMAPCLLRIREIAEVEEEQFGPVLHVLRYQRSELDSVLAALHATGYGLTLGVHSRNTRFIQHVYTHSRAGNVYVNRNMIGAVVGVQPFGGSGLSGTGPKAGGPHYVQRFALERTLTDNIAAIGGNVDLLTGAARSQT
ncbi:MAG: bifunctional proline dehydrogenase/L-glutamate gamma-semialdehyde dehydrogenase PutA [Pseudomonadota bacterium]